MGIATQAQPVALPRAERPSETYGRKRVRNARIAVSSLFFQQGLLVGAWSLHIPIVLERLSIDKAMMGNVIVVFGLGSIAAMLSLGPYIGRNGSRNVTRLTALASSLFLLLVSLPTTLTPLFAIAVLVGASIGAIDVAMNAQAVEVERRARHAIMSSFHAFWSMGTLTGALVSGWLIERMGALGHAGFITVIALLITAAVFPFLVRERVSADDQSIRFSLPRAPVVWLLGVVCLLAYVVEGAAIDWSAIFMRDEVQAPFAVAGWALAALQITMMLARFGGDRVRDRLGAEATLRWGALLAAGGFALAASGGLPWAADWPVALRTGLVMAGFFVTGLGLANIVPIAFAASSSVPGVKPAVALSIIAMFGYAGILVFPALLGWVGEHYSLTTAFLGVALLTLLISVLARAVSRR